MFAIIFENIIIYLSIRNLFTKLIPYENNLLNPLHNYIVLVIFVKRYLKFIKKTKKSAYFLADTYFIGIGLLFVVLR